MLFAKSEIEDIQKALIKADLPLKSRDFLLISICFSLVLALIVSIISFYFLDLELAYSIVVFIIVFSLLSLLLKRLPKMLSKARASSIEADLSIAVRAIAIQLNMKVPFDVALENTAYANYKCSQELKRVVKETNGGASIPEALYNMSERIDSTIVKKIIVQLVRTYEEGGKGGNSLKKLADEIISMQKIRFREFSAQLSFLGLLFIAFACIAPTLSLTYGLVASMFFDVKLSSFVVWLLFLLIFPLINAGIILYIRSKTPELITETKERFLSKKEKNLIAAELKKLRVPLEIGKFFIALSFFSLIAAGIFVYFNIYWGVVCLFIPLIIYFIILYLIDQRSKEIESYLPDALFQVGALEHGVPIERIIQNISRSGYGALSVEFSMASRQISAGTNVESALAGISERNSSTILDRMILLLNQCYRIGKDVQSVIRETAEDVFDLVTLAKEQAAILAMQRYTILFGGCIIIPIILAFVISVLGELDYSLISMSSAPASERKALIESTISAIQAYLVIYACLASIFIAHQEGRTRKAVIYFVVFGAVSVLLFNFVRMNVTIT